MKKNWMIICFFAILLLPNLLGLAFGYQAESENTEKRELAGMPVFSWETMSEFPGQVEDYINDHAPFRSHFIDAYASFNMEAFHSIDNKEVIVGKDKWLFYTGNESMIDTLGVCPFTEDQHKMILDRLLAVRDKYVENKDDFIFYIAPNKEIVYRQFVPEYYDPLSDTSKAKELVKYIRENSDIKVVYPLEELTEASKDQLTYYKTDTHWNNLGGFIGVQELIGEAGGEPVDYRDMTIRYEEGKRGDLGDLGHTPMRYLEETEVTLEGYHEDVKIDMLENNEDGSGVIKAKTDGAPDGRSLTMVRDSFAIAMAPVLMRYFSETTFVEWQKLPEVDMSQERSDLFVYEIVERNLGRMSMDLDALLAE